MPKSSTTAEPATAPSGAASLEHHLGRLLGAGLDDPSKLDGLAALVPDWQALVTCARWHGLVGALDELISRRSVEVQADVAAAVRREAFMLAARQQPLRGQLFEALEALEAGRVRAVALKGPLLAERLYANAGSRQSADIDLLVARADVDRALEALGRIGYYLGETEAGERFLRRSHYQLILLHPERAHLVELHFRALRAFGGGLDAEAFLDRARLYEAEGGGDALVLAPEDEMLYLAVHAAKHFRLHLKWLYDIVLFVRRYPDLDMKVVFARARAAGVERGLSQALDAVERFFGVAIPRDGATALRTRARSVGAVRALAARAGPTGPVSTLLAVAHGAILADTLPRSLAVLRAGLGRIARRRAHRYVRWLVPDDWAG
jgi:hypothetical protein